MSRDGLPGITLSANHKAPLLVITNFLALRALQAPTTMQSSSRSAKTGRKAAKDGKLFQILGCFGTTTVHSMLYRDPRVSV